LEDVVCTVCLVRSNKVSIEGSRQGNDGLKLTLKLTDKIGLENLRTLAGIIEVCL